MGSFFIDFLSPTHCAGSCVCLCLCAMGARMGAHVAVHDNRRSRLLTAFHLVMAATHLFPHLACSSLYSCRCRACSCACGMRRGRAGRTGLDNVRFSSSWTHVLCLSLHRLLLMRFPLCMQCWAFFLVSFHRDAGWRGSATHPRARVLKVRFCVMEHARQCTRRGGDADSVEEGARMYG